MMKPSSILMAVILSLVGGVLSAAPEAQWSGAVAAVSGDDLSLAGVPDHFRLAGSATELLSGRSVPARDLAPGSSVALRVGTREADGRFRVDALVVQPKTPLSLSGELDGISSDRRRITVQGVEIEIDDHTAFSGRAGSGVARSARDLKPGVSVRLDLAPTVAGALRASAVSLEDSSGPAREDQELKGTVTAIADTLWTIDGRNFTVTEQTRFEGDPQVGDFVEVKFHLDADGNAIADRIETEDDQNEDVEFVGTVEAIGDTSWTISGQVVSVDSSTEIDGNPAVGDSVEVHAVQSADATLLATRIHKEDTAGEGEPGDDNGGHIGGDDTDNSSGHGSSGHGENDDSTSSSGPGSNSGHGGGSHNDEGGDN